MRKWSVPHSSAVSDGGGIAHSDCQHTQNVPTISRGVWQITGEQAELVLSGKPDGSFLVWERSGIPVYDPSSLSIETHDISVV